VQTQLLNQYPSESLRVYAVWLPMLWSDARALWNGRTIPDARVTHFWDGERAIGQWFARHIEGYEGIVWDAYYLYSPDATWETTPSPLSASGGTIYAERENLEMQIRSLLEK
jgi:hypothetical protein